jgi:hypothetical protein
VTTTTTLGFEFRVCQFQSRLLGIQACSDKLILVPSAIPKPSAPTIEDLAATS